MKYRSQLMSFYAYPGGGTYGTYQGLSLDQLVEEAVKDFGFEPIGYANYGQVALYTLVNKDRSWLAVVIEDKLIMGYESISKEDVKRGLGKLRPSLLAKEFQSNPTFETFYDLFRKLNPPRDEKMFDWAERPWKARVKRDEEVTALEEIEDKEEPEIRICEGCGKEVDTSKLTDAVLECPRCLASLKKLQAV